MDCVFTSKLGIQALIREAMNIGSVKDLSALVFNSYTYTLFGI